MTTNKVSINVASFKDAFNFFVANTPEHMFESVINSFSKLKEKGKIEYNVEEFWCSNHYSSNTVFTLYRVEKPLLFYVVEENYSELSDNSHSYNKKTIFVP